MIRVDDIITIDGIYSDKPNPAWRWWAFWRHRHVLKTHVCTGSTSSGITIDG